ncbi:MAG: nuclear transport factor 2 family protein, partial [Pseudomonadota bacterium]
LHNWRTAMSADLEIVVAPTVDRANPDVAPLIQRVAKWQQLFSPEAEWYRLEGYLDLFEDGPDALLVYDNYAEEDTRWLGFDRYRRIWEREINTNFPGLILYRVELDRAEVTGDVAWTAFTWFGRVALPTGVAWPTQHATHIWRRREGVWRIAHEHLTSGVKEAGVLITKERRADPETDGAVWRHSLVRPLAA